MQWYHVDLHLHTPASIDYHNRENVTYLDILQKAEARGLDIIAFTDHNTVHGYGAMMREIEQLDYLVELGRARPEEETRLQEYQRLLEKILVLPGFEFTATFGFHILGLFSPKKSVLEIEHLLLNLNIPIESMEEGNSEVGASSDVLTAYEIINAAGGVVIAAHANASHGVAMRGMDFGGQTRIAYTQDKNLHALEVTDLCSKRRNSTQRFFNGTKPEYPRQMRCIQGSDAHALEGIIDRRGKVVTLGVGDRTTELLLPERSFDALLELFQGNDFSRSREFTGSNVQSDYIQTAREEGPSLVRSFHESMQRKGGKLYNVVADVCAFANTNRGTVFVGLSADAKKDVVGVDHAQQAAEELRKYIDRMISPPLTCEVDVQETVGKSILRVQVPYGEDRPYAIDDYKIYVRDETDTNLAVRDEIVSLVRQGVMHSDPATATYKATEQGQPTPTTRPDPVKMTSETEVVELPSPDPEQAEQPAQPVVEQPIATEPYNGDGKTPGPPRAGVEIIGTEQRNGTSYHIMRDLRNGNVVQNVTRSSARRLWHYAIKQRESNPVEQEKVQWHHDIGLWRSYKRGNDVRFDLVQRESGRLRVYYGVSEAGMHGPWQVFLGPDDDNGV